MRYALVSFLLILQGPVAGPDARFGPPPAHASESLCNATGMVDLCSNILAAGWDETSNLEATKVFLQDMKVRTIPTQVRKSSSRCRLIYSNTDERQELDYAVPVDLARLPATGLQDRDVVIALFNSDGPGNCWEAKYGTRRWTKQLRREVQFVTVRLDTSVSMAVKPEKDRRIGTWTSWSISSRLNIKTGARTFSIEQLKRGQWTQCAVRHEHEDGYSDYLAFIGCEGVRAAASFVAMSTPKTESVNRAIVPFSFGDAGVRQALLNADVDRFTASAWGRCGSFGCCSIDSD